jgi:hypothetical protein
MLALKHLIKSQKNIAKTTSKSRSFFEMPKPSRWKPSPYKISETKANIKELTPPFVLILGAVGAALGGALDDRDPIGGACIGAGMGTVGGRIFATALGVAANFPQPVAKAATAIAVTAGMAAALSR